MTSRILLFAIFLSVPSVSLSSVILTGTWTNTTFASSGDVELDISLTPPTSLITIDFDGGVFGVGDPPPLVLSGTANMDGSAMFSAMGDAFFGDVSGAIDAMGNVSVDASNLPTTGTTPTGLNVFSASLDGMLLFDSMSNIIGANFNYLVIFNNCGGPCNGPGQGGTEGIDYALGVINTTVVPLPATVWLFGAGILGLMGIGRRQAKVSR